MGSPLYLSISNKNKKIAPLSFPESKMVVLKAAQQNMKLTGLKLKLTFLAIFLFWLVAVI
jgi:hypothetical protein